MSAIRSSGNRGTEIKLARLFRAGGITGWRRKQDLFGKPDFIFRREKVAVFVDGCFWHGCRRHCRMPKSRSGFWKEKIERNKRRDVKVNRALRSKGWLVLRIWEHNLKRPERILGRLQAALVFRR